MHSILIVDDNVTLRRSLELSLAEDGYEVSTAGTGEDGLIKVKNGLAELVFLDLKLPDMSGIEILRRIKEINEDIIVVVITAYGDVKSAVEAMKLNAYDYITKPFEIDEIKLIIEKSSENLSLKTQIKQYKCRFDNIIGKSQKMRFIYEVIEKIVQSKATTVLIYGETGTGKGLLARTIHDNSARKIKPFIDISCSALQDNLIESELFGYEKGAFTDAKQLKKGLIEQADGGTLFIDEVGELQPSLQVKLLKVIDEKTFRRVGGVKDIRVDIRIIAATNRNLEKLIASGHFREDLYYRLKVVTIYAPPLRERKSDIPLLTDYFLTKFNTEFKKKIKSVSSEAMDKLINQGWTGNVRELKNTIERICLLEDTEIINPEHLFSGSEEIPSSKTTQFGGLTGLTLEEIEIFCIKKTLKDVNNNKSKAAEILGISRHTLRKKIGLE
jgi:DNA-binding NtrC family response regulator